MLKLTVLALLCSLILVEAAVAPPKDLSEFRELLEKEIAEREQEELAEREQEELDERELEEQRFFRRPSIGTVLSAMINLQVSMARTQKEHTELLMQIIEMMNEEEDFVENAAVDENQFSESESESGNGPESGSSSESGSSNDSDKFVENAALDETEESDDSESESESGDGPESGSSADPGSSSTDSGSSSASGASSESGSEDSAPSLPPTRRQSKWIRELEIIKKIADTLEHTNQ